MSVKLPTSTTASPLPPPRSPVFPSTPVGRSETPSDQVYTPSASGAQAGVTEFCTSAENRPRKKSSKLPTSGFKRPERHEHFKKNNSSLKESLEVILLFLVILKSQL